MSTPRISLCVIARDEEAMLGACLASAKDVVSQIIVIDTGSRDDTVAVARAHGAEVEHFAWRDDFAAARNASIVRAEGDWVLILDADERLAPGAANHLVQSIRGAPSFVCGMLRIHDAVAIDADPRAVVRGEARIGEPMFVPRLLRRTPDLAFEGIVHESVRAWLVRHDNRTEDTGANIVHLGAVPDTRASRGKRERNVSLLEKRRRDEPHDFTVHGYLAHEHLGAGDEDLAWRVIEEGWAIFEHASRHELRSALRLTAARAMLQFKRGDAGGALLTAERTEAYEGRQPDLSFFRGRSYEAQALASKGAARVAHLDRARAAYRDALSMGGRLVAQRYVAGSSSFAAATRLGTVELLRGEPDTALALYDDALGLRPDLVDARLGRVEALLRMGDVIRAEPELTSVLSRHDSLPDGWLLAALAADVGGDRAGFIAMLGEARARSTNGYVDPHRNALHGELHCELVAYLGEPAASRGALGAVTAVLAGEAASVAELAPHEEATVLRFVRNLLRWDRADDVNRLLTDEAQAQLPWLVPIVRDAAAGLGMAVEEA